MYLKTNVQNTLKKKKPPTTQKIKIKQPNLLKCKRLNRHLTKDIQMSTDM